MSAWSLLAVPLCLLGMVLLLAGMSWFEQRVLSPRSLIVYTARSRHVGPDTVEMLVTKQSEELVKSRGPVQVTTKAVGAKAVGAKAVGAKAVGAKASEVAVVTAPAPQPTSAATRP